jgi:2-keto-4-pentenoate hydratase/2-oxohepta-3-ene-1,7-dioic acid hydratase in catechol pathway
VEEVKLTAPIDNVSKIVAIGLNYMDHAEEGNAELPKNPICFCKFPTSLVGPGAEVRWSPSVTGKVDYEAELVVVIGKEARRVPEAAALDYVFGYTCGNDVSARDLQFGDGQWVRGKSLDTFAPIGPWIVTADEIPNPQTLGIRCQVNGQTLQESNTTHMIFGVAYLVHFLSQAFTLLPGDLIFSGTPSGVGVFRDPPVLMRDGDEMVIEIDGIGRLVNRCRTEE